MSIVNKNENGEYVLVGNYDINTVYLRKPEPEHTHQFIELVYTQSGKGIHKINGREYHVKSGDILIVNFHCRHAITPIENLRYVDIMLKPEYVNNTLRGTEDIFLLLQLGDFSALSSRIIKENLLLHFEGKERKRIEFLLEWTGDEQAKGAPASDLILYSALRMLLCLVFRKMAENQNVRITLNDHLLDYMKQNCTNRLIIKDLAAKCGYTAEHFSRMFKEYTGKTPVSYMMECRINKAKELLIKTDQSIDTIMFECGFSNRTAFFKKFSEMEKTTPLQFRKNQK